MHSQTIVDDCQRISRRPHLAGANEMITAVAILAGEAKPFVVSLQIVSGVVPRGIWGAPVWWFSASRTVTSSLPLPPNSGQWSAMGGSWSIKLFSACTCTGGVANTFVNEKTMKRMDRTRDGKRGVQTVKS